MLSARLYRGGGQWLPMRAGTRHHRRNRSRRRREPPRTGNVVRTKASATGKLDERSGDDAGKCSYVDLVTRDHSRETLVKVLAS